MAVGLGHPQIDRQVGATGKRHGVIEGGARAPVRFGQAVDAQAPPKPAALEGDDIILLRREIDLARHNIRIDPQCAAPSGFEPQIDAGQIAGRHRAPGQRGAGVGLAQLALGIEEVHRRDAQEAIAGERALSLPQALASAAPIYGALPKYAQRPPAENWQVVPRRKML